MLVMENKSQKIFLRAFAALFAFSALISFAKPVSAAANEGDYMAFSSESAMADTLSFMSFSMARIGDQTFLPPQYKGNAKGKSCDGNCLGNFHVKAFANSDMYSAKVFENKKLSDNAGAAVSYSSDRKYGSFDTRYAVFGGYMMSRAKYTSEADNRDHYENQIPFAGVSAELYKGNFFAGLVLSGLYMQGKMMFEGDNDHDSDSWAGAAGLKLGYNVNLGKIGVQPFGTAAYSYFKADKFAEEKYHADNNVAFASGLKAAVSLGKCWSLSAIGDYNWMYNKSNAIRIDNTADKMANYVEYGIGLEKKWSSIMLSANGTHRDGKRDGWYADLNFEVRF